MRTTARIARLSKTSLVTAVLLLAAGCGEKSGSPDAREVPPISGAAIDAIRAEVRARLEGDPAFRPAERLRVERTEEGARIVVHVTLAEEPDEQAYARLCETIAAAAASVLVEGQTQEVYFLKDDAVVHSCGP